MLEIWLQFKVRTYEYNLTVNLASKENEQVMKGNMNQGLVFFMSFYKMSDQKSFHFVISMAMSIWATATFVCLKCLFPFSGMIKVSLTLLSKWYFSYMIKWFLYLPSTF